MPRPASPDGLPAPDRFWAEGRLPAEHLSIEIEGLGLLPQPLPSAQAQALHDLSEPAQFGLRDQTLLDPSIRHTGEVSADLLSLDWQPGAFAALKWAVAQALGVERLDAWLHNLLIYGPGQFFKPHQDTEKHPGMVATLVLVWPSLHLGGTLQVHLGNQSAVMASQHLQTEELRWFAFYADCRHEVLPVQEGWRVALTFDLVLPVQARQPAVPEALQAPLQAALRQQFALDSGAPSLNPWVLLLDHEYTEHGLRWPLLKGDDRWRVAALRQAAEALGLRLHLALAELHETWSAQPVFRPRHSRYGRSHDEPTGEAERGELLEHSLSLDFWVDTQDRVGPRRSLGVSPDNLACFTETGSAHLVDEQYEGYMGNYGETLDYWYRRAALVIRAPLADERDRFDLDFESALDDARQLARDPVHTSVLASRLHAAAPALARHASDQGRVLLAPYAEITAALPNPDAAMTLLASFDLTRFEPGDAQVLARLEQQHGTDWLCTLIRTWTTPSESGWIRRMFVSWRPGWPAPHQMPRLWPQALPDFVRQAQQASWSVQALEALFGAALGLLVQFGQAMLRATPAERLRQQDDLLAATTELALALSHGGHAGQHRQDRLITYLLDQPALYPPVKLRPVVEATGSGPDNAAFRQQVVTALRTALAEPERAPDEHHLRGITWTCHCTDCNSMIAWAESPLAQPLVMAMAEQRRRHVETEIAAAGAPLAMTTLRQGSPHKLVLSKPADLHVREQVLRAGWRRDLDGLAP